MAERFCVISQVSPGFIPGDDVYESLYFEEFNDPKYEIALLTAKLGIALGDEVI